MRSKARFHLILSELSPREIKKLDMRVSRALGQRQHIQHILYNERTTLILNEQFWHMCFSCYFAFVLHPLLVVRPVDCDRGIVLNRVGLNDCSELLPYLVSVCKIQSMVVLNDDLKMIAHSCNCRSSERFEWL